MFTVKSLQSVILLSLISVVAVSTAEAAGRSSMRTRQSRFIEQTSEENREGKDFYISAQLLGSSVGLVNSKGLNLGYYLSPDSLLQLEGTSGKSGFLFGNIETRTVGINLKQFLGNSFYVKGGAMYRKIGGSGNSISCTSSLSSSCAPYSEKIEATSYGLELAIGNQWQWSNFTLGCDWIGVMMPLTSQSEYSYSSSSRNQSAASYQKNVEDLEKIAKIATPQFLRFYLGASF